MAARFWPVLCALILAGCTLPTDALRRERVLGIVQFHSEPILVEVPDTVDLGRGFRVRVTTHGGGCMSPGPTRVRIGGLRADVTPFDYEYRGDVACTAVLESYLHEATLRFAQPGVAIVRVNGRREPAGEIVSFEYTVIVR